MNTRLLDATDTENKEGWVYCPKRKDLDGCLNGGACSEGGCVCPEGTSGEFCEIVDPCVPNPCQNGGSCSEGDCTCPDGFEGVDCETKSVDLCDPNPCENGGSCKAGECTCPEGFTGESCETKVVDPCNPNPCQNKGVCAAGACSCPEGFSGEKCEVSPVKKCPIANCASCKRRGRRMKCRKCNAGFRRSRNRRRCLSKKEKDPDCPSGKCPIVIIDENENGIDDEEEEQEQQKNCKIKGCLKCNKRRRRCKVCKKGTRKSYRRRRCLKKNEKDPDCPSGDCGDYMVDENGNGIDDDEEEDAAEAAAGSGGSHKCKIPRCKKCSRHGGRCRKCARGTRRAYRRRKCLTKKEVDDDCPSGNCPAFIIDNNENDIDDDDEDDNACLINGCARCNRRGRRCRKCNKGFRRSYRRTKCLAPDEVDEDCPGDDCPEYIVDLNGNGIDDDEEDTGAGADTGTEDNCHYESLGCYKDRGGNRHIIPLVTMDYNGNPDAVDKCFADGLTEGYPAFALQN